MVKQRQVRKTEKPRGKIFKIEKEREREGEEEGEGERERGREGAVDGKFKDNLTGEEEIHSGRKTASALRRPQQRDRFEISIKSPKKQRAQQYGTIITSDAPHPTAPPPET